MDCQRSSLLSWPCYYQGKSIEELRQSLFYTTLELETTRVAAQEEIKRREDQLTNLKDLLSKAIKDRDEALDKCQKLLLEKLIIQQQNQQQQPTPQVNSGVSSIEDDPNPNPTRKCIDSNHAFSSSDCEESIVSSLESDSPALPETALRLISGKAALPEKGKLLEAVMKAGPLLQTLLLAGPLPQWRHPPPPLEAFEIPPVTIPTTITTNTHQDDQLLINVSNCGMINNKKRGFFDGDFDDSSSPEAKYQRVLLH